MKRVKHGWRIYIDDGRWLGRMGIQEPEGRYILFVIPFTNFRIVLESPGVDNILEPGKDF